MAYRASNSLRRACYRNLLSTGQLMTLAGVQKGNSLFVDSSVTASGDGSCWPNAFKTITEAVAAASAGDTIYMTGSFTEEVTCSLAGVRFIGVGSTPRNACYWTATAKAGGAVCLTPTGDYIEVANVCFRAPAYSSSGTPAAIALSGSNYLWVHDCIFRGQTGSHVGIYSAVCDSDNVTIENCQFLYFNTATYGCAILGVEAGGLNYSGWRILNCKFNSNLKHVDVSMRVGSVRGCEFPIGGVGTNGAVSAALTTMCLDLSGTNSGANVVSGNVFAGEYDTDLYVAGALGDTWVGNYTLIEATDAPYGLTVTDPAAED